MRSVFVLVISLSLVVLPCLGCGGGKPDPRDDPDFVDTTDPMMIGDLAEDPNVDSAPAKADSAPAKE